MSTVRDSLLFDGGDTIECDRFIRYIRMHALNAGREHDNFWVAKFAAACLGGEALRWHLTLDLNTRENWAGLEKALVARFSTDPPPSKINTPSYIARIRLITDSPDTSGYVSRYQNSEKALELCKLAKDALWVKLAVFSPFCRFQCLNAQSASQMNDWLGIRFQSTSGLDKGKGNNAYANITPMSYMVDGTLQDPTGVKGPAQTAIWEVMPNKEVTINWVVDGIPYDMSTIAIAWPDIIYIPVDWEAFLKTYKVYHTYIKARMELEYVEV